MIHSSGVDFMHYKDHHVWHCNVTCHVTGARGQCFWCSARKSNGFFIKHHLPHVKTATIWVIHGCTMAKTSPFLVEPMALLNRMEPWRTPRPCYQLRHGDRAAVKPRKGQCTLPKIHIDVEIHGLLLLCILYIIIYNYIYIFIYNYIYNHI